MSSFISKTDYTLLDNQATHDQIVDLCKKAIALGVKSVCVMPVHVAIASKELASSPVKVCTVISFPEGRNSLDEKERETIKALEDGADEIDMVLNYHRIVEPTYLLKEISSLVKICKRSISENNTDSLVLKVIVESGNLTIEQTRLVTQLCIESGADFIKTSTGKVTVGAEIEKVKAMRDEIQKAGASLQIKASGGIRAMKDIELFDPYVDRFGIGYQSVDALVEGGMSTANY